MKPGLVPNADFSRVFLSCFSACERRLQRSGFGMRSGMVLLTEMGFGEEGGSLFNVNFKIPFVLMTASSLLGKTF